MTKKKKKSKLLNINIICRIDLLHFKQICDLITKYDPAYIVTCNIMCIKIAIYDKYYLT